MDYRLPSSVVPTRYDLRLEPDLDAADVRGRGDGHRHRPRAGDRDRAERRRARRSTRCRSSDAAGTVVQGSAAVLDERRSGRASSSRRPIAPGEWRLRLAFTGHPQRPAARLLPQHLQGRGRRSPRDRRHAVRGHRRPPRAFRAGTSPPARRCSPSRWWSRPGSPPSPTPRCRARRRRRAGKKVVRFADTIKMSTYLVAFIVGELEATEPVMVGATPLRVWCVPGKKQLAALRAGHRRLLAGLLRELLRPPVSGRQARPPRRSRTSRRAPWRTSAPITFRETALLVDEARGVARRAGARGRRGRPRDRPHVVRRPRHHGVVERHLAQRGLRHLHGDARRRRLEAGVAALDDLRRVARRRHGRGRAPVHAADRVRGARPARTARRCSTSSPTRRAPSVLRMLEQYLGPEVFREGVRATSTDHRFANAETDRSLEGAGHAAGQPIPEVMDGWIFRPGYPLVTVEADGAGLRLSAAPLHVSRRGARGAGSWRHPHPAARGGEEGRSGQAPAARRRGDDGGAAGAARLGRRQRRRPWLLPRPLRARPAQEAPRRGRAGSRPSTASTSPATPSRWPRPASCRRWSTSS